MNRKRHALLAIGCFLLLVGCASKPPEPQVITKTVNVEVPVHCKPTIGDEPNYADSADAIKAAPDFGTRLKLIMTGRLQRIQRLGELLAALKGCE